MYLWIDLETTGLDPDNDRIIEIGWFLTDGLQEVTEPQSVLITISPAGQELMDQDMFVKTMHTENGLLDDMKNFGSIMIEDAEDQILEDLYKVEFDTLVLAGSSVHFDRGFIRNWMPRLDEKLSHRHFDVSVLRMFFDNVLTAENPLGNDHVTKHRALEDVVASHQIASIYGELVHAMGLAYINIVKDI